jgi:dTDP-4-amino-4,6-dideoxygalactose transaminase
MTTSRSVASYKVQYPEAVRQRCLADFAEILESGNLVLGRFTTEFEKGWAAHIGMPHAAAVQSDSAALEIALRLCGKPGQKVVMPCMSFFGCVEAVYRAEMKPVLVDIDIENGVFPDAQVLLDKVDATEDVACVLGVYTAGYVPADLIKLVDGLRRRKVRFIEDVAHCHGTKLYGRSAGSFGNLSCWSFFATKVLTTGGEGGMILAHDPELIEQVKTYRNYGRGKTWGTGLAAIRGYNWRMTEFQAAVGCEILKDVPAFMEKRLAIAAKYDQLLKGQTFVTPVEPPPDVTLGYYRYIVLLPQGVSKEVVKAKLGERGVGTQGDVYEVGLHEQPIYPELLAQGSFPQSEEWAKRHLCLPIHLAMNEGDEEYVVQALEDAVRSAG